MNIAIIWAGFGGLSAAIYLAKAGHSVTIYEKNEHPWGRASVLEVNWFRRDMWPSWYLMPDAFQLAFADRGEHIEDYLDLVKLDPMYRVYFSHTDRHIDILPWLEANLPAFEAIEPWVTASLCDYLAKSAYQYDIAMRDFVPKNYDSYLDFFTWKMMTEGTKLHVFEKMKTYVARYVKSPELQKILSYPLVFLWTAPKDAPALYNIMSHVDFGLGVFYPQWGIYEIIQALVQIAEKNGVKINCSREVTQIVTNDKKQVTGIIVDGTTIVTDLVVSNADMHWTETKLLPSNLQTYPETYWAKKTMAPSWFIVYLGVKWRIENLQHHTLLFSPDRDENFWQIFTTKTPPTDPSLYVCCPSKTDYTVAPDGYENLFILVPFPAWVYLDDAQKQEYKLQMYALLEETIGEKFQDRIVEEHLFTAQDFADRYHAFQWSALWLAHTLGQSAIWRPNNVSKKVKGLYYTWWYTNPGIGMPMCMISGKLVAERIKKMSTSWI